MTDAECQEAMDKGEMVRYVGRNPRLSGQTGWIIGRQTNIRGTTLWSVEIMKSTIRCTADLLQQVVAGSSPPLHPFKVGDHVLYTGLYTGSSNSRIPYGTPGTVQGLIPGGSLVQVLFPSHPPASGGRTWDVSIIRLQHATPTTPAAAPPAQATSLTLPSFASWTGYEKLTIHRSQSAVPPRTIAHHPHRCPRCSGPAYIGFSTIECADKACR